MLRSLHQYLQQIAAMHVVIRVTVLGHHGFAKRAFCDDPAGFPIAELGALREECRLK